MLIRVLGPVQVFQGDDAVEVGPPQRCAVLAALAVDAGRLVTQETLVDRVWGPVPPPGAWRTAQTHIANLRVLFREAAAAVAVRRRAGYVLAVDPDLVDVHRMRRLAAEAADLSRMAADRLGLWREAVGLWRGEPLAGLTGVWVERVRQAWYSDYRDVVLSWARAEIEVGNPTAVPGRLDELIVRYPLVESLPAMLMRALYAAGRRAEALDCYTAARQRLDQELAEVPGPELQATYQAILRRDVHLPPPIGVLPAGSAVPAQLPADVRGFAGRADHVAELDAIVATAGDEATAVVISAIAGTAGVGKTALAVHWAHRAAKHFPDGQLYVNLRGFDSGGSILEPADAMRGFLDALAVPPERIPANRDAQAALYRTLLADKRMLVLLDNARDTEQVRPLLPGTPGCLVLVTSRNRLTSLIATTGAHPLALDLLTLDEARDLLTRRLGAHRIAAEPEAVDRLVTYCARLPLALATVAARAATHTHLPLATLATELADARTRLDALADPDPATDIRTVFSWSYATLTPSAQHLFRLLGLHPGPDVTIPAAAGLSGLPAPEVQPLLAELTAANLIVEPVSGRYTIHDLLRAYAIHLAHTADPPAEHHAATRRLLDHYLYTAYTANRLLNPTREQITLAPAPSSANPEHLTDHHQALDWFTTEHFVLLSAINHAASTGFDTHTWQLAWAMHDYLERLAYWHEVAAIQRAAVDAAEQTADLTHQALAHRLLARAYRQLDRYSDARAQLRHALDKYERTGHHLGRAHTHHSLAMLLARQSRYTDAIRHAQQAFDLYLAAGHHGGQGNALNSIGWYHARLGNHYQALTLCQQALGLFQEVGDESGQAATWDSLGYIHHHLGRHNETVSCYEHAIDLYRGIGDRYNEAAAYTDLGDALDTTGDTEAARSAWQQALTILNHLNHPDADNLCARLGSGGHLPE